MAWPTCFSGGFLRQPFQSLPGAGRSVPRPCHPQVSRVCGRRETLGLELCTPKCLNCSLKQNGAQSGAVVESINKGNEKRSIQPPESKLPSHVGVHVAAVCSFSRCYTCVALQPLRCGKQQLVHTYRTICHAVLFTHLAFARMLTGPRRRTFLFWSWPLVRRHQRKWWVRPWIAGNNSLEPTTLSWGRWGCLKIVEITSEPIGPPSWFLSLHLFTPALIGQTVLSISRNRTCCIPASCDICVRLHMPHGANFIARQNRRFFCGFKACTVYVAAALVGQTRSARVLGQARAYHQCWRVRVQFPGPGRWIFSSNIRYRLAGRLSGGFLRRVLRFAPAPSRRPTLWK